MAGLVRRTLRRVARFCFITGFAFAGGVGLAEKVTAATVFTAAGVFDDGAILSGTLTIDTVTGSFESAYLFVSGDPKASSPAHRNSRGFFRNMRVLSVIRPSLTKARRLLSQSMASTNTT